MPSIEIKNFAKDADEVATPNNARVETVNLAGQRVMKLTVQPGWKRKLSGKAPWCNCGGYHHMSA